MGAALETPEGFAVELAEELLKRKAYALVDDDWMLGRHGPIAMDDGAGFDQPRKDRQFAEEYACRYLSRCEGTDACVRLDGLQVKAMPNGKGFVEHVVNLYGSGEQDQP